MAEETKFVANPKKVFADFQTQIGGKIKGQRHAIVETIKTLEGARMDALKQKSELERKLEEVNRKLDTVSYNLTRQNAGLENLEAISDEIVKVQDEYKSYVEGVL